MEYIDYLHYFTSDNSYQEARNNDYYEPWVSLTEVNNNKRINYNKTDDEKLNEIPLTFEVISGGSIQFLSDPAYVPRYHYYTNRPVLFEYRINDGDWAELPSLCCEYFTTAFTLDGFSGTFVLSGVDAENSEILYKNGDTIIQTPLNQSLQDYYKYGASIEVGDEVYVQDNPYQVASIQTKNLIFTLSAGDRIQFRGNNPYYCPYVSDGGGSGEYNYSPSANKFYMEVGGTLRFNVKGNIMSLINATDFVNLTTIENYWEEEGGCTCFESMFSYCDGLVDASKLLLPATVLAPYCYQYMFHGCSNLTKAPERLPATNLSGANYCYNTMFQGCTSLTTASELPATTLANNCYMQMFDSCSNLNYIKCLATDISASNCTYQWLYGVASSGTFVKNSSMSSWSTGDDGIPYDWTVENA